MHIFLFFTKNGTMVGDWMVNVYFAINNEFKKKQKKIMNKEHILYLEFFRCSHLS